MLRPKSSKGHPGCESPDLEGFHSCKGIETESGLIKACILLHIILMIMFFCPPNNYLLTDHCNSIGAVHCGLDHRILHFRIARHSWDYGT